MRENKTSAKTKYLILIFGAFAIFFTGYPHIWSIYQPYAMELTGWSQSQASMGFYLSFLAFVPGNIIGGRIQDRSNPGSWWLWEAGYSRRGFCCPLFHAAVTGYAVSDIWDHAGIWAGHDIYHHYIHSPEMVS